MLRLAVLLAVSHALLEPNGTTLEETTLDGAMLMPPTSVTGG